MIRYKQYKNMKSFTFKLIFYSLLLGLSVGILELYIGHRFILDKLLIGRGL